VERARCRPARVPRPEELRLRRAGGGSGPSAAAPAPPPLAARATDAAVRPPARRSGVPGRPVPRLAVKPEGGDCNGAAIGRLSDPGQAVAIQGLLLLPGKDSAGSGPPLVARDGGSGSPASMVGPGPGSGFQSLSNTCYAARRSPLRGKAGELVSASTGPDRTAALIHYAIGDSAPTLRVGPHNTRAPPGRGQFVSTARERSRGGPISRSGRVRMST
jgi:hypothetical protein